MILINKHTKLNSHMTTMPINGRPLIKQIMLLGFRSKEEGNDRKSIQSSTTPDPNTIREIGKNTRKHHTQERHEVSIFPAGDHKSARNRQDGITKTDITKKITKEEHRLGTVSKKNNGGL